VFRGIKFNTPWASTRPTPAFAQPSTRGPALKFGGAFSALMSENASNPFCLCPLIHLPTLIQPKTFPKATNGRPQQFAEWQHLYHEIFRMAKERGLDTYVVFWSIFVSEEFAKAHGIKTKNFYPHYYVDGDTSEATKRYLRESVTQMLEEYPDLDGI